MRYVLTLVWLITCVLLLGCANDQESVLRIAVTTSTRDSGLLDVLIPVFEDRAAARVDVVAVGTGAALKLGEAGDVDVVLVHARDAEDAFMSAGYGSRREEVMFNTFDLLGPASDPARVNGLDPVAAMQAIARHGDRFVSRGDQSGTHQRELKLWEAGGGRPEWDGYLESGLGMGKTLIMADEMQAYVLADRGTMLRMADKIELHPLVAPTSAMLNPYGIILVSRQRHSGVRSELGNSFIDFMIGKEAQELIRDFRVGGEALFVPLRLDAEKAGSGA